MDLDQFDDLVPDEPNKRIDGPMRKEDWRRWGRVHNDRQSRQAADRWRPILTDAQRRGLSAEELATELGNRSSSNVCKWARRLGIPLRDGRSPRPPIE